MWDKNFCLTLFLNFYNQLFWLENNLFKNQNSIQENSPKEGELGLILTSSQKGKNQEKLAKNLETEKIINNKNLESLFASENELSEVDQIQVQNQINFWLENKNEILAKLSEFTNEKTLITTKAILICAYLEIENFKFQKNNPKTMTDSLENNPKDNPKNLSKDPVNLVDFSIQNSDQNSDQNNPKNLEENIETTELRKTEEKSESAKIISKYLKLAQNYVDNKNTSLIHAILTKLCADL